MEKDRKEKPRYLALNTLVAVAVAAAAAACVGLFREWRRYRAALGEETRVQSQLAAANRQWLARHPRAAVRPGPATQVRDVTDASEDSFNLLMAHPDLAAIQRRELRYHALYQYGKAIDALKLPPDQRERLLELLTDHDLGMIDLSDALLHNGIRTYSPEYTAAVNGYLADTNARVDALLGREMAEQFRNYQSMEGSAGRANSYGQILTDAGIPLNGDQQTAFAGLIKDLDDAAKNHGAKDPAAQAYDPADSLSGMQRQILQKAAGILDHNQLAALKDSIASTNRLIAIQTELSSKGRTLVLP